MKAIGFKIQNSGFELLKINELKITFRVQKSLQVMDTTTKIALVGIVFGAGLVFFRLYIAPLMAENELKRKYQSAATPQLVLQSCEMDTDFWAKVKREKARYEQSGNRWSVEQNPVIPFPFNAEFSFQWFDKRHDISTVGLGQREYLAAAIRQYDECLKVWQTRTGKEFGYDATMAATGQKPFEETKIWN